MRMVLDTSVIVAGTLLRAAGAGKPPMPGDEIPDEVKCLRENCPRHL